MTQRKKPYFPNNWEEYKAQPDDFFVPITFAELLMMKIHAWEMPSSVCCMIREQNVKTGKVKEHIYQRHSAADRKIHELYLKPDTEFTVCDPDTIHFVPSTHESEDETEEDWPANWGDPATSL